MALPLLQAQFWNAFAKILNEDGLLKQLEKAYVRYFSQTHLY